MEEHAHICPRCELRFLLRAELEDHLATEHGVRFGSDPAEQVSRAVPPPRSESIVVAVDPEHPSVVALDLACAVARQGAMGLDLVAVPPAGTDELVARTLLNRLAADVASRGLPPPHLAVLDADPGTEGSVAAAIVSRAADGGSPLVCVAAGRAGTLAGAVFGSVAEAVLRASPVPVLVAPRALGAVPGRFDSVVVALDGSELAERAVGPARELAMRLGCGLLLAEVVPADLELPADLDEGVYLRRVAARLTGLEVGWETLRGDDPAAALATWTAGRPWLLTVATHGRSGLNRVRFGSVTADLARIARVPLMVQPPPR